MHTNFSARLFSRPAHWLLLYGGMCLLLGRSAFATDSFWPPDGQQDQQFIYTIPTQNSAPPMIDATNFDIENLFEINFAAATANPQVFETWNTLNYTNNGLMVANSPLSTNGIFLQQAPGCGFLFDTQTTNVISHRMAGTFYNAGEIRVNSVFDNDQSFFFLFTAAKVTVLATNIINSGSITAGENGLIQFTGQNVDLTRGTLVMENLNTLDNLFSNLFSGFAFFVPLNINVLAANVGHETNFIDPAAQFSLPNPSSDAFVPPLFLGLKNATAYVDDTLIDPSNRFVRAVFISNPIPNVTNNVYFSSSFGGILVEWNGVYLDPTTGMQATNHMYLEDDFGEITNLQINLGGGPVNYSWLSQGPFFLGPPALSGLPPGTFDNNFITNDYAYESVQVIPTTVATNASLINPSGALTNMVGRIQINASHDLDLTLAQISGPNYMSITATNHFEGSSGASIFSPFSDINLAVTNGLLSVSNLLAPSIPNWNGPAQVFSARWQTVDALGVTNTFHVLLLNSQLVPTTVPYVQDLILHATNTFISDSFNVIRKLSLDATSLTVTTNLNTDGFGSQDGELNWYGSGALNSVQLPNLHWLTNNGVIRSINSAAFGSASVPYGAFINNGLLADQGSTIYAGNFLSSGTVSNGSGAFLEQSITATLTNGSITATSSVSFTTSTLLVSNVVISAGKALNLTVTNKLTDSEATNGNFWFVGAQAVSGSPGVYLNNGFNLPLFPTNQAAGDLHHTTVSSIAGANKLINNLWAAQDRGATIAGFSNNVAIGRLILDALGSGPGSQFYFSGTAGNGATNALYVDELDLRDWATNTDANGNVRNLNFNTNLVIYYAQATYPGFSVASKLNHKNGDHLRWVPAYAGVFSSTNLVYPPGVTNTVNAALAQDPVIDSDGDGTPNGSDPTPFFVPAQMNFTMTLTNVPPLKVRLQWSSIPAATNSVLYKTNLLSASWLVFTNFVSPTNVPPVNGWPLTNTVYDTVNPLLQKYYRVRLDPNSTNAYGP